MLPTFISTVALIAADATSPGGLATLVAKLLSANLGSKIFNPATRTTLEL
jgi:hypothetical protein